MIHYCTSHPKNSQSGNTDYKCWQRVQRQKTSEVVKNSRPASRVIQLQSTGTWAHQGSLMQLIMNHHRNSSKRSNTAVLGGEVWYYDISDTTSITWADLTCISTCVQQRRPSSRLTPIDCNAAAAERESRIKPRDVPFINTPAQTTSLVLILTTLRLISPEFTMTDSCLEKSGETWENASRWPAAQHMNSSRQPASSHLSDNRPCSENTQLKTSANAYFFHANCLTSPILYSHITLLENESCIFDS